MSRELVVTINASHANLDAARDALLDCREITLKEAGCKRYDLFTDLSEPDKLVLLESWASDGDLDRHMGAAHFEILVRILNRLDAVVKIMKLELAA